MEKDLADVGTQWNKPGETDAAGAGRAPLTGKPRYAGFSPRGGGFAPEKRGFSAKGYVRRSYRPPLPYGGKIPEGAVLTPPSPPKEIVEKPQKNPDGSLPRLHSLKYAASMHLFPWRTLWGTYYVPTGEPAALFITRFGKEVPLYDKDICPRLPLPCVRCGQPERYRAKLCRACFEKKLAAECRAGDARRAAFYGFSRSRVLYFDLEFTGVYDHDEVLSVSLVDGFGNVVFDSLIRPLKKKTWPETEPIHGITPEMVKNAPTLGDVSAELRRIIGSAERMVGYGSNTDVMHLCRVFSGERERFAFRRKVCDCAVEFNRYVYEHDAELTHRSLSDAMAFFSLEWRGTAHSALADARACRAVYEKLFPHYYDA